MRRPAFHQRGSTDLAVLAVLLVVGMGALYAILTPRHNEQVDAATMFASAWSRAEIEAPDAQKNVWKTYRTCWLQRESKPFTDQGPQLMSWKVHPQETLPVPDASGFTDTSLTSEFTAEDLLALCDRQAAQTHDPAVSVVHQQVLALLKDRETDVTALAPPSSLTRIFPTPPQRSDERQARAFNPPTTAGSPDSPPPGWS